MAQTVLAFDFGTKKIGTAVGQTVTGSAKPLQSIKAHNGQPDWSAIDALIDEWQPGLLLVGKPLNLDGTNQPILQHALGFAKRLEKHTGLPVALVDERLTTKAARSELIEQGEFADDYGKVDNYAAKLIIESWWREIEHGAQQ